MRSTAAALLVVTCAAWAADPELPRVYLDTHVVAGAGRTISVAAGGDLQAALDAAALGDTVVVASGATFTGTFFLGAKSGSGWITVRPSNMAGIPAEGVRATPANAGAMAKLVSNQYQVIKTVGAAHHWRLVGLEVSLTNTLSNGLIQFGDGETTTAALPHDLIIDRCYVHGIDGAEIQDGLRLNSASSAVIDSYFEDCHSTIYGSNCIAGYNGPGPYKIVDNYLGGSTINCAFGGAIPSLAGVIPSDIEFRRNRCVKPLSYRPGDPSYRGTPWYVKNFFELKNAQRVLLEGNSFEQNFLYTAGPGPDYAAQQGYAFVINARDENKAVPWALVQDVTIRNNIVRGSVAGVQTWGGEGQGGARMRIANNLFTDIGLPWGANSRSGLFIQLNTFPDVQIDHNTILHDGDIAFAINAPEPGFVFTNNIANHACARTDNTNWGINGGGTNFGFATLNQYMPGYVCARNAMVAPPVDATGRYPAGNWFPSSYDAVGFANRAGGDYHLAASSPYKRAGTDGKDVGADIDAIAAAMAGTVAATRGPFGGVARAIPGVIEAEDFDEGGEGVAYHDGDASNNGGGYRNTGVDIRAGAATAWQVGWFGAGEWLEYTVNVTATASYDIAVRVACGASGGSVHVAVDGVDATGPLGFGSTGSYDAFVDLVKRGVALTAGSHVLRLSCDTGNLDCDRIAVTPSTTSSGLVSGQWYKLYAEHSGNCLAVAGSSTADAANVWSWHDDGTTGEEWQLIAMGDGSWELLARCSGDALDMGGWSLANGGDAIQWPAHGGANQRWLVQDTGGGWYRIQNVNSGKVLDCAGAGTADGTDVIQWDDLGGANQRWSILPAPPRSSG